MPSFFHSGDAGDSIYALPVIKALGGGRIYFDSRPWTRSRFNPELVNSLRRLFESQDFVEEVELHNGEEIDFDLSTFRNGGYKLGDTIVERQRRWLGGRVSLEPWLEVEPLETRRIVINRAPRWLGFYFPWKRIVEFFGGEMVFIGLPGEHKAFAREFGDIEMWPTPDLYEAARVIAGAELFIGNQSACLAIAIALGKKALVEVCCYAPDCFYPREEVQYSIDGAVKIELGERKLFTPAYRPHRGYASRCREKVFHADDSSRSRLMTLAEHARLKIPPPEEEVEVFAY